MNRPSHEIGLHIIDADLLEDIVNTNGPLVVVLILVEIKSIRRYNQVEIEVADTGYLIRKESIEIMFDVRERIKIGSIAEAIDWQQLETIQVLSCQFGKVTIEVIIVGHLHMRRI
jgi:hypothetical protein